MRRLQRQTERKVSEPIKGEKWLYCKVETSNFDDSIKLYYGYSGYFQMNKPLIDPEEKKEVKAATLTVPDEKDIPMIDDSPNPNRVSINDLKHYSRDYCKSFSEETTQEPVV